MRHDQFVAVGRRERVEVALVEKHDPPPVAKEKILCCGWRRDIRDILKQLDKQVAPGSELHMMSDTIPINERNAFLRAAGLDVRRELTNLRIVHFDGNTAMRRSLEALPIAEYDSCMIFADQAMETEMMHSDSHVGPRRFFFSSRDVGRAM